jgi:hypothetical protein
MKFFLLLFGFLLPSCLLLAQEDSVRFTVSAVRTEAPRDLPQHTLLVPRYDLLDPEPGATGDKRKFIATVNKNAMTGNRFIKDLVAKHYPHPFRLVSLGEVDSLRAAGERYFLDMVLMPKQMREAEPKAMIASFRKFRSANRMFVNRNAQFHFYFYIRDLQSETAYVGSRFRGHLEAYNAMQLCLKRMAEDLAAD